MIDNACGMSSAMEYVEGMVSLVKRITGVPPSLWEVKYQGRRKSVGLFLISRRVVKDRRAIQVVLPHMRYSQHTESEMACKS